MSRLSGLGVRIAGAGALGSVLAFRLLEEGARVTLLDPAARGDNASGVAAGMLAPAFEAALDPVSRDHFALLSEARDRWTRLASHVGAEIDRSGALWVGSEAALAEMAASLTQVGASAELIGAAEAERMQPGLRAPQGAAFTTEDWRLDPGSMLRSLHLAIEARGGVIHRAALQALGDADLVVLATGLAPAGVPELPPELSRLSPIKGQIAQLPGAEPLAGPVVRVSGAYVVPSAAGAIVGATMEAGAVDRTIEAQALERLRGAAAAAIPSLAGAPVRGAAGVRSATPDGLPMAGPSSRRGVWLALGARRNGWLLAPLIADVLVERLTGAQAGSWAAQLDPLRPFS